MTRRGADEERRGAMIIANLQFSLLMKLPLLLTSQLMLRWARNNGRRHLVDQNKVVKGSTIASLIMKMRRKRRSRRM